MNVDPALPVDVSTCRPKAGAIELERRALLFARSASAEGLPAAAGAAGVGVLDGEPGALEAVLEVEDRALEELGAGGVDVEEHLVAVARTPAGTDGDAEGESVVSLGFDQGLDLGSGVVGDRDHG